MNKLIIVIFAFIYSFFGGEIQCDPELKKTFQIAMELQETRNLVSQVQREGDISIQLNRHLSKSFEGYWSSSKRVIYITESSQSSMLTTLLFELHNAKQEKKFSRLYDLAEKGKISKEDYTKSMEKIEYQNAIDTVAFLNKGIEKGIFPKNSYWSVPASFEEHYSIQQSTGHSKWIADGYDDLRGGA